MRATPLTRYALATYALIVIYATLYPLAQWRVPTVDMFAFLAAPWPRYLTKFDVGANIAAYLPLGALLFASLPRRATITTMNTATFLGLLLSLILETLQSYLPSRIPSNVDVALNTLGTFGGAAIIALAHRRYGASAHALRAHWFRDGARADAGLALLGLWLVAQLNPEALLFGTGDLRDLFAAVPSTLLEPLIFVRIEALVSAANLVAVGLIAGALVRPGQRVGLTVMAVIIVALAIRTAAFAVLAGPDQAFAWYTPGASLGLAIGTVIVVACGRLGFGARLVMAGVLLMATTAIVNVAPGNPYIAAGLAIWRQGHFLNFNGLTWAVSAAWPFAALAFLLFAALRGVPRDET